jgi:phosphoenolpyruvate synthase/pyruvate phosphate dikinase
MDGTTPMVCWFEECNKDSVDLVGGKCSSLGELINAGVRVPPGFALTTHGYPPVHARRGHPGGGGRAADRSRP